MNMPHDVPDDSIARLIRAALDAEGARVAVIDLEASICRRMAEQVAEPSATPRTVPIWRTLARRTSFRLSLAAASLLIVAGLWGYLSLPTATAQAYALVRSAQQALAETVDREYSITFDKAAGAPVLSSLDEARVWTRGDRYRVEFRRRGKSIVWGKDEQQRIWVVCGPKQGLLFEPEEIPPEFAAMLSYLSLDLQALTGQILNDCDLTLSQGIRNQRAGLKRIKAVRKPTSKLVEFSTAQIDIDESTSQIRRLELARRVNGRDQGRCLFVLAGKESQPDESYQLATHLDAGATILDQLRNEERLMELFRTLRAFRKNN